MQTEDDQWVCPSFNSYSSIKLADIAAKVSDEVNGDVRFNEESLCSILENVEADNNDNNDNDDDDDFEFAMVTEEIYYDGKARPIFPIFNRNLLNNGGGINENSALDLENNADKIPLRKLFIEEREGREPPSSSEEEDSELESAPPGTYCVWKAKKVLKSPSRCKKSKSTGSGSKRWKLRDLLRRSNSDGKDSFVFLTPKKKEEKTDNIDKKKSKAKAIAGGEKSLLSSSSSSPAHDALFTRSRVTRGNETPRRTTTKGNETPKRKTYLPYRQDLVGFFATVNTLGRTFPPF